ncbi:MAG TPA: hypothetical protein VMJ64_02320 [Anaerolineales bacterium]|nr:hypothetical protein [Anaerolineales bacterium]
MIRIPRLTFALILAVAALAAPTLLAAAKELAFLTVRGPGIGSVLTLNDAQGLLRLQQYGFFGTTTDTSTLPSVPQNLGTGYTVAGYLNLDGTSVPFVQGVYYPAMAGEQGYIHFTGGLDGSTMKPTKVDRWAVVTPEASAVFNRMVAAQGVMLQVAVGTPAAVSPVSLPAAPVLPGGPLSLTLAAAALVVLAGGMWMQRRRVTART